MNELAVSKEKTPTGHGPGAGRSLRAISRPTVKATTISATTQTTTPSNWGGVR